MKCVITSCSRDKTPNTPYCTNCGAGINSWSLRRPSEIDDRQTNLAIYVGRMGKVTPRARKGKRR